MRERESRIGTVSTDRFVAQTLEQKKTWVRLFHRPAISFELSVSFRLAVQLCLVILRVVITVRSTKVGSMYPCIHIASP